MTATLMPSLFLRFLDNFGNALSYGSLYTAVAGTTAGPGQVSPKATYTDSTEATANPNPVILDSAGCATVWIDGFYSMAVYDVNGNFIRSANNVAINQITSANIQEATFNSAIAGGTSDAITAAFNPVITSTTLASGNVRVSVRSSLANATTTPTFTPNYGVITAAPIVKGNNVPLAIADIAGAGHWLDMIWDSTLSVWVLMNPATNVVTPTFPGVTAGGTSGAITASYTPVITTTILASGRVRLLVCATAANITATPTFTPNASGISPYTIVKGENQPLTPGDIGGAGYWMDLQWDPALTKWVLINPATGASPNLQLQSLTATVSSNALTITLNSPTTLSFRSATLASGVPILAAITSPLQITIPSGATLGTVAGVAANLNVLVAYNGGSPVLCVANASGVFPTEANLISPTTISSGATNNNVIYSASSVAANSPFRVVGGIGIAEAAAGVWATAPAEVQGTGGNVVSTYVPTTRQQVFGSSGTFTVPYTSFTNFKVTVQAGGGGGAAGGGGSFAAGGGGGAGGAAIVWLTGLIPGLTINVTVGSGGAGGVGTGGGSGGSSSITSGTQAISTVSATGGSGGALSGGTPGAGGAGGAGSGGSINMYGSPGTPGNVTISPGGAGFFTGAGGTIGTLGGGGAGQSAASSSSGYNGGAGLVIFEWVA